MTTKMALRFHLFLPQMRMTHAAIVERALAAEAAGFEGIAFMDHLAPPLAEEHDMWEAMAIASWVLAHTTTLHAGHLVLCDAFRHPAVLARQVTSLDHASGGRFELGIGWGSVPSEFDTFGTGPTEPRRRVDRLTETLAVVRALWTGEQVDFAGEYFTLVAARQRPVPTQPIPITIGGVGPRTLGLVREHASWWNLPVHRLGELDVLRERAGTARVSVQLRIGVLASPGEREDAVALASRRYPGSTLGESMLIGTVDELTDALGRRHAQGVERVYCWFTDFARRETLARFAEVIDALGARAPLS